MNDCVPIENQEAIQDLNALPIPQSLDKPTLEVPQTPELPEGKTQPCLSPALSNDPSPPDVKVSAKTVIPVIPPLYKGNILGTTVYDSDFKTIFPEEELHDNVIDAYLKIMNVVATKANARVLIFPSNLLSFIAMGLPIDPTLHGPTRLFHDLWFIPTQIGRNHWIAIAVFMRKKIIVVLNSLKKTYVSEEILDRIKIVYYLMSKSHEAVCGSPMLWLNLRFFAPIDVAVQKNSSDCGVFVCLWAYALCMRGNVPKTMNSVTSVRVRKSVAGVLHGNAKREDIRSFACQKEAANEMFSEYDSLVKDGKLNFDKPWEATSPLRVVSQNTPDHRRTNEFLKSFLDELFIASKTKCGSPFSCRLPRCEGVLMLLCELCREWLHLQCMRLGGKDLTTCVHITYKKHVMTQLLEDWNHCKERSKCQLNS